MSSWPRSIWTWTGRDDARRELESVVARLFTLTGSPEEREFKKQAEAHLRRLR